VKTTGSKTTKYIPAEGLNGMFCGDTSFEPGSTVAPINLGTVYRTGAIFNIVKYILSIIPVLTARKLTVL
jgi:hypothetical protein